MVRTPSSAPEEHEQLVLARVDRLVADGRALAALDELDRALAASPAPALEVRAIEVRHAAMAELTTQAGRPSWPPTLADPFPDATAGPPEISDGVITAERLGGGVLHHGSVVVRRLLPAETAERLADDVRRAFEHRAAYRAAAEPSTGPDPWFTPFDPGTERAKSFGQKAFVRAVDSPRSLLDLLGAYRQVGLVDAISGYLGERPALSALKCALRRTKLDGVVPTDFHQDGAFLGEGIRTMNVWLALSACGGDADAPGLDLLPRRLDTVVETGGGGAAFDWTLGEETVAGLGAVVRPPFEPGDALVFDEMLVHRTGMSAGMQGERLAVECWFFAPSRYPDHHVGLAV